MRTTTSHNFSTESIPVVHPDELGHVEIPCFHGMVGQSKALRDICDKVYKAARADCTVLIQGESGTGKELVARAIHMCSKRAASPFIPVDCGAINPNLIESELFGHLKGAFTGAHMTTRGLLRAAEDGTVFLDEIAEIPLYCQAKLLRALQEMEVMPVGSVRPEKIRARIVAATNRDLATLVAQGIFRQDLYYRLQVLVIDVPPLRERREDIPLLAEYFLRKLNARNGTHKKFAPEAIERMIQYDWPGNIRELQNSVERAYALCAVDTIGPEDFPTTRSSTNKRTVVYGFQIRTLDEIEREAIEKTLEMTGGIKTIAARALGIGVTTLYRKLQKYNIQSAEREPLSLT